MRQLFPPTDAPVDLVEATSGPHRKLPTGRPWVLVNMIATADGATAVGGVSGPLGGPGDKAVFSALRRAADVVLVGAGTVRAEDYGPTRARPDGTPGPRIAVVTRSGDLDPRLRLFESGSPLVLTCRSCPPERRAMLTAAGAEVILVGDADIDLAAALDALRERGAAVVLCEGGPTVNGHLIGAGLVDEWYMTIAPLLAAGTAKRAAVGDDVADGPTRMHLDRLLEEDGYLFARYLRSP